jgi:DNA repair protein RAD5
LSDEERVIRDARELAENGVVKKRRHPLWDEYHFKDDPHNPTSFYINPFSYQLSLEFPEAKGMCRGALLCDEMGMGKTVMALSLIAQNHMANDIDVGDTVTQSTTNSHDLYGDGKENHAMNESMDMKSKQGTSKSESHKGKSSKSYRRQLVGNCSTLVVCPVSLLAQWRDETSKHTHLSCIMYHGADREQNARYLTNYDVVVTSYGTLKSEFRKQQSQNIKSPLLSVEWYRVFLDEAHFIRNRRTEQAKAVFKLKAIRRWCLTGTPIQNSLADMFSLLHFLCEDPWCK